MCAKKRQPASATNPVLNRRAHFDYSIDDELSAGIALTGPEVRSIRDGRAQLKGAFVTIRDGELWLNNASLTLRGGDATSTTVDTTPRKLLVHKKQLAALGQAKQQGMTIVPLKLIRSGRYIKVVIATAKGKKRYDKREALKRRDQERDARRS